MNKIFTLLFLVLIVSSCKKDKKQPQPEKSKIYLVSKITLEYGVNAHRLEEYKYDDQNRIIQSSAQLYSMYPSAFGETYKYTYDSENRVTKAEQITYDNKVINTRVFVYTFNKPTGSPGYTTVADGVLALAYPVNLDAAGRVKQITDGHTSFYDTQGHLLHIGELTDGDFSMVANKYDDKQNPFANAVGLNPNINYFTEYYPIQTVNNVNLRFGYIQVKYTYNIDGFPVSSAAKNAGGGDELTTFEYIVK